MEGVVVSRQICLAASAVRQRLVFEIVAQQEAQIDAGRVPQPAGPQCSQNQFCFTATTNSELESTIDTLE
ncbi:hypothetical protein [Lapidilactobacillus wuchangensis]|uniref:hypothetical protein n=1 Tax=Lapidilactobacillus wuchangensis TaxID=2486001 RepID=UPI0013DD959F|nr:hypothetical protein [Lapidilactobacillus wuchangensis]